MISVVIPAYNEEQAIEACLAAFVKQTFSQRFEIILVDNSSTDKTVAKAHHFAGQIPLRIIHEKKKGRGAARKAGFHAARGQTILSTDADTVVPPYWIEKMAAQFTDNSVIAVTGTGIITDKSQISNTVFNILQPLCMKAYRVVFGHYWLTGFNFAIRKKAYIEAGEFNADLNAQEDTELAFRVKNIGKIKFVGTIPVVVSGRRYKKGVVIGFFPYIATFLAYYVFKKKTMILSDPR